MDWGFELSEIAVPISIWHGTEDRFVPPAHGRWFAEQLPAASFHMLPDEGHISMFVRSYGVILDELLAVSG